jgi:hypothetical protein
MRRLAREVTIILVEEYGPDEVLSRLSDPFWFQAFGCVLGFDWHSSGLTTTVCGALKEGLRGLEKDLGLFVAGGKGKTSRQTPSQIEAACEGISVDPAPLVYTSRMVAKVDSAAVQDAYQIYHHCFFFTGDGSWCVVQQGMNEATRYARRYHWKGRGLIDFVCEPHEAICCDARGQTLNMVARESEDARSASAALSCEKPEVLAKEAEKIPRLELPEEHRILKENLNVKRLEKILLSTYERQPEDFEQLLGMKGVGPKTIRALSLLSEVVHGARPSFRDPARFSYAHGGKDGHPYPVARREYDRSIEILRKAVQAAKIGNTERLKAFKRLSVFP